MTPQQLAQSTGATLRLAIDYSPHVLAAMSEFEINTPARQAAFLAQIGHESGGMKWLSEIWGPTPAQRRYEGRKDLGNTQPGDGSRFRGRGLIQTTGRANYVATGKALGLDLIADPTQLGKMPAAARSAAWFWKSRGLNELADAGRFELITRRINGGLNGYADRLQRYANAKKALGVQ